MNRLKEDFKPGAPLASLPADWLNTVARWLNSVTVNGGPRFSDPYHLSLFLPIDYEAGGKIHAWQVSKSDDLKYTIETGDIEIEPDTVIAWGSIIDDDTGVAIPAGNLEKTIPEGESSWFVWVNIVPRTVTIGGDVYTQGARLFDGNSIVALTSDERAYTIQRRVAEIAVTDNVITRLENLQCGNIDTSASASADSSTTIIMEPAIPGGNGYGTDGSDGGTKLGRVYAFECYANEALTGIYMEPGDVVLGPLTWIHWSSISGATQTPAVTSTNTCVWLEINVEDETAVMNVGTRAAMESALDAAEQLNTLVAPIVETFWTGEAIVKVKNRQCGDVKIPRAGG